MCFVSAEQMVSDFMCVAESFHKLRTYFRFHSKNGINYVKHKTSSNLFKGRNTYTIKYFLLIRQVICSFANEKDFFLEFGCKNRETFIRNFTFQDLRWVSTLYKLLWHLLLTIMTKVSNMQLLKPSCKRKIMATLPK